MADTNELNKAVLTVLNGLILAAVVWMAKSTSESQVAQARIEERLQSQSATLIELKKSITDDVARRQRIEREFQENLDLLEARVSKLEFQ